MNDELMHLKQTRSGCGSAGVKHPCPSSEINLWSEEAKRRRPVSVERDVGSSSPQQLEESTHTARQLARQTVLRPYFISAFNDSLLNLPDVTPATYPTQPSLSA
ncbi:hypothetical protein INR49_023697 [Caranx melampygus]|nr:hypothetical protein INR49_023697 [Caranx melampygus]